MKKSVLLVFDRASPKIVYIHRRKFKKTTSVKSFCIFPKCNFFLQEIHPKIFCQVEQQTFYRRRFCFEKILLFENLCPMHLAFLKECHIFHVIKNQTYCILEIFYK